jgi:hypothetical protein
MKLPYVVRVARVAMAKFKVFGRDGAIRAF